MPNTSDVGESDKRKPADLYLITVGLKDFYCISFMSYFLLRYIYSHFIRNYAQRLVEIYYLYHGKALWHYVAGRGPIVGIFQPEHKATESKMTIRWHSFCRLTQMQSATRVYAIRHF